MREKGSLILHISVSLRWHEVVLDSVVTICQATLLNVPATLK
jgi:hypothetical protein